METSTKGNSEAVELRLEKLEKSNRRLSWVSLALGAGLISMFALGTTNPPATPEVVIAKRLEIKDSAGKTRIALDVDPAGQPQLWMRDDNGNTPIHLTVRKEGPILMFIDEKHNLRAGLSFFGDEPALQLFDRDHLRAVLTVKADGPAFNLFDKDGKMAIWQAPPK